MNICTHRYNVFYVFAVYQHIWGGDLKRKTESLQWALECIRWWSECFCSAIILIIGIFWIFVKLSVHFGIFCCCCWKSIGLSFAVTLRGDLVEINQWLKSELSQDKIYSCTMEWFMALCNLATDNIYNTVHEKKHPKLRTESFLRIEYFVWHLQHIEQHFWINTNLQINW